MEQREEVKPADAMQDFAKPIQGQTAKPYDPMERIPTLTPGDDLVEGSTICGVFERLEKLTSDKFKQSNEIDEETGKKVSRRVVLKRGEGENAKRIAIWASGSLKQTFQGIEPGTYVEITYDGKKAHPTNDSQTMHYFSFKLGEKKH